jgi:hypothetical protein
MNHMQYELAGLRRRELVREGAEQRLAARAAVAVKRVSRSRGTRRPQGHRSLGLAHRG